MNKTLAFIVCVVALLLSTTKLYSQTGTLKGFVHDKETGEPCMFANVSIPTGNIVLGASTDMNGYFSIPKIPVGTHHVVISYLGYNDIDAEFTIVKEGQLISKNFQMEKSAVVLQETVISAEREEQQTQVRASIIKVSPAQIKQLPSVGGEPDIAQFLQVLPGVTFTGDQGGQLYIRGGSNIQNLVLIDGMTIYNPFHSIGLFSVFDSDIIRNADVYTGGFNAEFGGRNSSVMNITMKDGNAKKFSGKFSASTFGSKLMLEGPIVKYMEGKTSLSYILSAKTSYLEQTSKYIYKYINDGQGLPFNYTDLYGKLSLMSPGGSRVNVFGFNFNDNVSYQGLSDLHWRTYGVGANVTVVPPNSSMMLKAHASYSNYAISLQALENYPSASSINGFNVGLDFIYHMGKNDFTWGLEMLGFDTDYRYYNSVGSEYSQEEYSTELAAFAKYKWNLGSIVIEPGFRLHYYASMGSLSPEPRLGVKYNIVEKFRLKLAAGLYSQNLVAANSDKDVVNLFYGFLSGNLPSMPNNFKGEILKTKLQKSEHVIFGFEWDIINSLNLNVEGYLKHFDQITTINRNKIYDDNSANASRPDYQKKDFLVESGYAYGVDFLLKFDQESWYVWAVYSLGWVRRNDGVTTYAPNYDRRHNVNLVATYKFGKKKTWNVSLRWNYGSGFPFTLTSALYENVDFTSGLNSSYWTNNGTLGVAYSDLNTGRLPNYHRLDLTINKVFLFTHDMKLEINIGVTNVYNRANIFYFDRLEYNRVDQLPIMPSFGLNFTF